MLNNFTFYQSNSLLSSGGTSTGADVAGWLCGWLAMWLAGYVLEKIGFETAEARRAPGSTIQVYSNKATVQVYSNSTNSSYVHRMYSFVQLGPSPFYQPNNLHAKLMLV
jgi:hypothetical protein